MGGEGHETGWSEPGRGGGGGGETHVEARALNRSWPAVSQI